MRKNLLLMVAAVALSLNSWAQTTVPSDQVTSTNGDQPAFVFSESELDLSDESDVSQDVIQIGSSNNMYTSNISYTFSPMWFKFRALDQRYNETYMNGVLVNSAESGSFGFSPSIGGLNDAYNRSGDYSSPFETNSYGLAAFGGSNNYNFRANNYAAGHKVTLSAANRNYRARAIYSFGTGVSQNGWAFFGTVGYRWANEGYVEGTFYNSLSYFLTLQKIFNSRHSLSLTTWGTPTERGQQGISTDEAYWLANDFQYNPYWGYQDGEKRNSRVVTTYEPSLLLTWDYKIKDNLKLTTSVYGKYGMDQRTRLQYNNSLNPKPDYWKSFPSYNYDVWGLTDGSNNDIDAWQQSYDYWTASKANRQIQWDKLY
ncbi:MAG: TonB-dependent receptor, partial [Bacteroidaceae bacterium]|nr:TonB-dependent receptor [Bacteroidaceae bacterium]